MASSNYFFRDDLQAEKDRLAANPGAGAPSDPTTLPSSSVSIGDSGAAPAPSVAPSPDQVAADAGANASKVFAPETATPQPTTTTPVVAPQPTTNPDGSPDYFADFRSSLAEQDPVKAQLQKAATEGLNSNGESFDPIATAARDKMGREIAVAGEENRQNNVKTFGSDSTGQAGRAAGAFTNEAIDKQTALETQLAGEKAQTIQQDKATGVTALNDLLNSMDSATKLQAQFALTKADQTFQEKMQQSGFVQQKDLQSMQSDLQKELQQRGFTEEQAIQISQQSFAALTQQRDEDFQQKVQTIQNAFTSGERVSSQDFQLVLQSAQTKASEDLATLQHTLNMDAQTAEETFQKSMQMSQNDFAAYLQTQGFDHDTALQASQQAAAAKESSLARASTELMATAQLAQQDKQFQAQLGLNQQELDQKKQELEGQLKLLGVQTDSAELQNTLQLVSIGIEMGNGDPAAVAPFAQMLAKSVQDYAKAHGITIDTSSLTSTGGTTSTTGSSTTSTLGAGITAPSASTASGNGSGESVQNAVSWVDDNLDHLPQSVTDNQSLIEQTLGQIASGYVPEKDRTANWKSFTPTVRAAFQMQSLINLGLTPTQAKTLTAMVVGTTLANSAETRVASSGNASLGPIGYNSQDFNP